MEKNERTEEELTKLKIVIVEPGKTPRTDIISDDLDKMQKIVGGYIECFDIEKDVTVVVNEVGKIMGLPHNQVINNEPISGTFFVVGSDYESGEFKSLSDEQCDMYCKQFQPRAINRTYTEEDLLLLHVLSMIDSENDMELER
ncbi:DUF3846 domain-containing protein [Anaeromicropila herbilytica]|uniref:DUF3846 domain-containing protein n=1 Tax=Anaeromicropila herbilytica TaxID=2785025 RepID=A0A7R7EIS4_9FIRM|nr:DUF3846 domain-containing protein [Anaeromicropila herbilytica]BCN29520.1 hypothetical protein bsdtb5_08150 [Anaeromicropila herbilytica]